MATIVVTNQLASQSLRGTDVMVTCDSSFSINYLSSLAKGQLCTLGSNSKTGTISFVDYKGHIFKITPIQPNRNLESTSTPGYLASGESISVTV